jgi:hypothetical protein
MSMGKRTYQKYNPLANATIYIHKLQEKENSPVGKIKPIIGHINCIMRKFEELHSAPQRWIALTYSDYGIRKHSRFSFKQERSCHFSSDRDRPFFFQIKGIT